MCDDGQRIRVSDAYMCSEYDWTAIKKGARRIRPPQVPPASKTPQLDNQDNSSDRGCCRFLAKEPEVMASKELCLRVSGRR